MKQECIICGKIFEAEVRVYRRQLTCSSECSIKNDTIRRTKKRKSLRQPKYRNCLVCGEEFLVHYRNPSKHIYCSRQCLVFASHQKAIAEGRKQKYAKADYEKHKEEILRKNEIRKNLERFGGLRNEALQRDDFKCQICGDYMQLCVHHKDFNKENNTLDNLQTLCRRDHAKIHSANLPARQCSIEGCNKKHYGLGYCRNHYRKLGKTNLKKEAIQNG